jgi:phosphocarrier protein HPr
MTMTWQTSSAVVRDPTGLHARPAVKLTKLAKGFSARVEIRRADGGEWTNAKSPSAVMRLKAPHMVTLEIRAAGEDACAAADAVADLVNRDFADG